MFWKESKNCFLSLHIFGAYILKMWNTAFSVFISHVNSLPVLSEKLKLISKAKCLLKRIATPFDSLDPHNHALAPPPCVFHSLSYRLISTPVQCVSCKQIQSYFFDTSQINTNSRFLLSRSPLTKFQGHYLNYCLGIYSLVTDLF